VQGMPLSAMGLCWNDPRWMKNAESKDNFDYDYENKANFLAWFNVGLRIS